MKTSTHAEEHQPYIPLHTVQIPLGKATHLLPKKN